MARSNDVGFRERIERIEALTQGLEQSPDDATRADAQELVHAILELHGAGFARLAEIMAAAGEAGRALFESAARDDLVGSLFMLYDLHPDDIALRVERALESVRPSLRSHGGEVSLLGVSGGVVRLKMEGSCHGCPSSAPRSRTRSKRPSMAAAPEMASIEVAGLEPDPPGFVSIGQLKGPSAMDTSRLNSDDAVRRTIMMTPAPRPNHLRSMRFAGSQNQGDHKSSARCARTSLARRARAPGRAVQPPAPLLLRRCAILFEGGAESRFRGCLVASSGFSTFSFPTPSGRAFICRSSSRSFTRSARPHRFSPFTRARPAKPSRCCRSRPGKSWKHRIRYSWNWSTTSRPCS